MFAPRVKSLGTMLLILLLGVVLDAAPDGVWVGKAKADMCDTNCHMTLYNVACPPPGGGLGGPCYEFQFSTCLLCNPTTGSQRCLTSAPSGGATCANSNSFDQVIVYTASTCDVPCDCTKGALQPYAQAANLSAYYSGSVTIPRYVCQ